MPISQLIKYEGDNTSFVWKFPNEDFNCLTELVVHEGQEAIFMANGRAADTFGPGRYKLESKNIPILTKLLDLVTGISIFHCEVYFITKTVQMAMKWGTPEKVRFIDPLTGVPLEIGASGEMNLQVSDGRALLLKLVGNTRGIAWEEDREGFTKSLQAGFRPIITSAVKANLGTAIKDRAIDLLEVDQHLPELAEDLARKIRPAFEEYGLTVPQFYITGITLPENDPNFKRIRDLHLITLQTRMAQAEATVRAARAQSEAQYRLAEEQSRAAIEQGYRQAELERQTTETELLRRENERKILEAQTAAQAAQIQGLAEAAVMQAQGYTKKDILQTEVQKAFAEGLASGGSGAASPMGDMVSMGAAMAAMGTIMPQMQSMMQGMTGAAAGQPAVQAPAAATPAAVCPACGAALPAGARFCMSCGAKITPTAPVAPAPSFCPNCGSSVIAGSSFCPGCGTKLN